MKEVAGTFPDASSYAPVTMLIDERSDGVHLSCDLMARLLTPCGSEGDLVVAMTLDTKVKSLFNSAAR